MTDTIAPLIVKWLTHDFASPIATVMTASELLSDDADAEINGLIQDAARNLGARLRLVRAALAPGDAPVGGAALERLVREGLTGTPVTWHRPAGDTDGGQCAVVAGAALLLADLRRGQPLAIGAAGVHRQAPHPLPEAVAAALAGGAATDGKSAVAAMLAAAARRAGLVLVIDDNGIAWG
ncbi:hypothetical protein [Sandarakinorhabdus sp. DWP1-3-1]|uniref:hypothetical protein n=1 Tax=Sandarakinorhabdus sp. DWP1-3-1 TaxID=2804627 RepID=UPI003CF1CD04